jgi:hypothetical protein
MPGFGSDSKRSLPVNRATLLAFGALLWTTLPNVRGVGQAPAPPSPAAPVDRPPTGWYVAGSKPAFYHAGIDPAQVHEGKPAAFFIGSAPKVEGFGTLMQTILAGDYTGKRMRLRAWVRSQDVDGWAGIWMRVDRGKAVVAFDNMQARAIRGTSGWRSYDVVLDVAQDATEISFGALLNGGGELWLSGVSLEPVGKDVALTVDKAPEAPRFPSQPVNLDFAQ